MQDYVLIAYKAFCLLTAIYGIYFAAISIGFIRKGKPILDTDKHMRFAVLVAARNEETCISGIVESIKQQHYPQELVDIYVIPNNCTDNTAGAALAAGAKIISVSSSVCSKGQALHEAFAQLLKTNSHDAYCVFDADNEADPDFLTEMNKALSSNVRAAKSRILAKNAHENWVCACYETYFCNANLFLNSARHNLNFSARLIGTGFAIRRDLMAELGGWNTTTLTEDAELYATLSARGEKIAFVPKAITYDEEPLSFRESVIQRRRWMSGVMQVGRLKSIQLLQGTFKGQGGKLAFDALMQLSFSYIQAWILPFFLLWTCADPLGALTSLPETAIRFYIGTFLVGGASLLFEHRLTTHTVKALFLYPLFIFSFLPLQTLSLVCPNKTWHPIRHTGVRFQEVGTPPA